MFVTPEYNYGLPAPLKNALDDLHVEWHDKPVGFVSYGGVSAGTRAVQMLKQVVTTLKMITVFDAVAIPFIPQFLDDDGVLQPNDVMEAAAMDLLNEVRRLTHATHRLRHPEDHR